MVARAVMVMMIACLTGVSTAVAQTPTPSSSAYVDPVAGLTLAEAIRQGLEHEPELAAARAEVAVARGDQRQAGLRPNPMVGATRQEQVGGMDAVTAADIEWPLDLFRRGARVATAERAVVVAEESLAERRRIRAADIARAYGDLLAAIRLLEVSDALVATDQRTFDLLRARVDEGASPALERNMADVELRRAQADRFGREADVEAARARLRRVIGADVTQDLRVQETLERALASVVVEGGGVADTRGIADRRADVRQAVAAVAWADAKARQAEREGRFDLGLSASYMRASAAFPQQGIGAGGALVPISGVFHNIAFGVKVDLPVRQRNQGALAAARAGLDRERLMHDARVRDAEAEISAAAARDRGARQVLNVFAAGLTAIARGNLEVVREAYTIGAATLNDLLQEQRRLLEVELAHVDALRMAFEARIALASARGEL